MDLFLQTLNLFVPVQVIPVSDDHMLPANMYETSMHGAHVMYVCGTYSGSYQLTYNTSTVICCEDRIYLLHVSCYYDTFLLSVYRSCKVG